MRQSSREARVHHSSVALARLTDQIKDQHAMRHQEAARPSRPAHLEQRGLPRLGRLLRGRLQQQHARLVALLLGQLQRVGAAAGAQQEVQFLSSGREQQLQAARLASQRQAVQQGVTLPVHRIGALGAAAQQAQHAVHSVRSGRPRHRLLPARQVAASPAGESRVSKQGGVVGKHAT